MTSRFGYLYLLGAVLFLGACGQKDEAGAPGESGSQTEMASPVDPATAGAINGSVKFTGTKPPARKISMAADAFCQTQHAGTIEDNQVVVNKNGTLQNVYVYVKSGLGDLKFPTPSKPVLLDQIGCLYKPHVVAVQTGQTLEIKNSDGVLHNVNARPTKNKGFNLGQPVKDQVNKKSFNTPEVMIPVKCDVHPWMSAYIGIQAHPYAAVTGGDGSYSLPNLPPGTYEIEAWHEKFGTQTQSVTIGDKETKSVVFTFKS